MWSMLLSGVSTAVETMNKTQALLLLDCKVSRLSCSSALDQVRWSTHTVRYPADEPMLTQMGFLDFFSKGRVA